MAWEDQDQAFVVYDAAGVRISTPAGSAPSGGTYDIAFGSTCSVAGTATNIGAGSFFGGVSRAGLDRGRRLRTFVLPNLGLLAVDLTVPDPVQPGGFVRHPDYAAIAPPSPAALCYFETEGSAERLGDVSWSWTGGRWVLGVTGQRQSVTPAQTSGPSNPAYPLVPTAVLLSLRGATTERFTVADFSTRQVSVASTPVSLTGVSIQDPHVCQVPEDWSGPLAGRWLLVATRQRMLTSAGSNPTAASISDIVLYVSPDADFQSVDGPFLVVDGLNALGAFSDPSSPSFRVWCSVPSAVVDGVHLLVYFMAEASDTSAAFAEPGRSTTGFVPGPGVVRVHLADLETAVGRGPGAEASWEADYGADGRCVDAVTAEPLGQVGIWVTDPDRLTGWYQPLTERFSGVRAADPAVVIAGGVLTLYFAVLGVPGAQLKPAPGTTDGPGLWRGSDFSGAGPTGGALLGRPTAMRGRDFLIRCSPGLSTITRTDAPDLLRPSNQDDGIQADPDPFEAPSGAWVVFHGRTIFGAQGEQAGPTGAVLGTREDAVVDYAAAPGPEGVVGLESIGPERNHPFVPFWHP